jgi:hypothetical protein
MGLATATPLPAISPPGSKPPLPTVLGRPHTVPTDLFWAELSRDRWLCPARRFGAPVAEASPRTTVASNPSPRASAWRSYAAACEQVAQDDCKRYLKMLTERASGVWLAGEGERAPQKRAASRPRRGAGPQVAVACIGRYERTWTSRSARNPFHWLDSVVLLPGGRVAKALARAVFVGPKENRFRACPSSAE